MQSFLLDVSGRPDTFPDASPETLWLANFPSKQTRRAYKAAVQQFFFFASVQTSGRVRTVKTSQIIAWREHLQREGFSPRSVNNKIAALSSLFDYLCKQQVIEINPVNGVKRHKINQESVETQVLTAQQTRLMLDSAQGSTLKDKRNSAFLHILFYTGCRISEALNLKVKDFYEDNGYFVLNFTLKGGKQNKVAIHQELQVALRHYLAANGHENDLESPLLLPLYQKGATARISPQQATNIFHKYRKKVGLPASITPHSARATLITQALAHHCSLEAVQKSVGHANITTTQAYDKREKQYRESASLKVGY